MLREVLMMMYIAHTPLLGSLTALAASTDASATYRYDEDGRVRSALYDDNTCIAYAYDANGNRTSQTNTNSSGPETSTWGTGTWGCNSWTTP